jgi:hypothetical protein
MEISDILFLGIWLWLAITIINNGGGGGRRARVTA